MIVHVTHNASRDTHHLTLDGTVLCRAAAQRLGIIIKSWQVFHDQSLLLKCFLSFDLPVFEYCSAVWCSAADSHLKTTGQSCLLLSCLSLSGRAGPLSIKVNKLLGSLGYRSNPQGTLLQAEWLRAEGEVGVIWPDPFEVHKLRRGTPRCFVLSIVVILIAASRCTPIHTPTPKSMVSGLSMHLLDRVVRSAVLFSRRCGRVQPCPPTYCACYFR